MNKFKCTKHHDFVNLSLYRFERANVQLYTLLPIHPIQNLCYRFRLHAHDHSPVAFLLRCIPNRIKLVQINQNSLTLNHIEWMTNEVSTYLAKTIVAHFIH